MMEEAEGDMRMPVTVRAIEVLAYLTLPILLVRDYLTRYGSMRPARMAVIWAISVAVCSLFIRLIARRRKNWVRWLFVLLTFAGIISTVWTKGFDLHYGIAGNIACYLSYLLSIVCACLLLTPASAMWFRKLQP